MFKNFFNDFFETVWEDFDDAIAEKNDKLNGNDKNKHYFHIIMDEYDNGRRVCHKEKEMKNGKIVKDINNVIEDKPSKCNEEKGEKCNNGNSCGQRVCKRAEKEGRIKYLEQLVEEQDKTIIAKDKEIENLDKHLVSAERALICKEDEIIELKKKLEKLELKSRLYDEKFKALRELFK